MRRALRHTVPVDGEVHVIDLRGPILHVGSKGDTNRVEVWTEDTDKPRPVALTVVGTGQEWPDRAVYLGTAVVPGGVLVWHLLGVPAP